MKQHRLLPRAFFLLVWACAGGCGEVREAGRYPVGVTTLTLATAGQPPVKAEIWYPAPEGTVEQAQDYAGGYRGRALRDAPLRDTHRYPLVLLSHGLRGARYDLSWVAEALASEGVLAVAVEHPGSDAADFNPQEAPKLWVRAETLSRALDGVLHDTPFGTVVEPRHIAAVGHSLGGSTALLLGGARLDAARFANYFPKEKAPADTTSRLDKRFRGVIALAPGTGPAFSPEGLAAVQVPTLLYSGSADQQAPEEADAAWFAKNIAGSAWTSIPGAGHYTFEPECTLYGKLRAHALCVDALRIDRHAVHARVVDGIRAFLARIWVD